MNTNLCITNMDTFWPRFSWLDFKNRPDKNETVAVLPIVGMADWGLGLPLDAEEVMSLSVIKEASQLAQAEVPHVTLPPLRFVLGHDDLCCFAMEPKAAHDSLAEIALSVKQSGFRKLVLYNSSPWNEDLADAAGRDLRISLGLQMFSINLSGLGLDLLPGRSNNRSSCRALASYLLDAAPEPVSPRSGDPIENFRATPSETPSDEIPELAFADLKRQGEQTLQSSARQLASLLKEVYERKPLPNEGALPSKLGGMV